jgi:hypothetical protein
VPGTPVPGTGGYRAILDRRPLRRLLDELAPERLEVSDRTTLRWTGRWAAARGVRSVMVSHDSVAALAAMFAPPGLPTGWLADLANRDTAAAHDVVVCTTSWAAAEFRRLGTANLRQVPLGVDLDRFHPRQADARLRDRLAAVALVLSPLRAVAFIAVQQGLFGVYLGCAFAPNHKGMPVLGEHDRLDFLRRQVLTSRNVRGGPLVESLLGGLNYQIEHHLFPSMPRPSLRRGRLLVRAFCAERGLPYCEKSLAGSYGDVLRHLHAAGRGGSGPNGPEQQAPGPW